MAVVSHPALSPEWSFPSPLNPFDAPTFGPHIEFVEHTPVHQGPIVNKRRAHEIDWDEEDVGQRVESRAKKPKTASGHSVDPQQLHRDTNKSTTPNPTSPQIEEVISILVGALTSNTPSTPTPPTTTSSPPPEPPTTTVLPPNAPTKSSSLSRPAPTSPLSNSPNRARFVRKSIGGSCAGKTEASLCRWVLCKNHFLSVRYLDPTVQSQEWVQTLHEMGWEELHPYFQAQAAIQNAETFNTLSAFSRWIEDDFDYDATEDAEGDWSDEEDEDGELHDDAQLEGEGQTGVWDSGVVLQLPEKSAS